MLDRLRRSRLPSFPPLRAWIGLLGLLALADCAPTLEDPERFPPPCSPDLTGPEVLRVRCSGAECHGAGVNAVDRPDLVSDGVIGRLSGVPSRDGEGCPRPGLYLGNCRDPSRSFLLMKLKGSPPFGASMPPKVPLCDAERESVEAWLSLALQVGYYADNCSIPEDDADVVDGGSGGASAAGGTCGHTDAGGAAGTGGTGGAGGGAPDAAADAQDGGFDASPDAADAAQEAPDAGADGGGP